MKPTLILIRGSPASGKSTLARNLAEKIKGKVALLTIDEFRWIMTAHEDRDTNDYFIAFNNFLYALENYLKSDYTIIVEDAWIRKHKDKATSIKRVCDLGEKYKSELHQILLKGSWRTIKHINTLRSMVIPQKELKEIFEEVYSKNIGSEVVICIDNKKPNQVLKEARNSL